MPPWLERALISVGVCHFMLLARDAVVTAADGAPAPPPVRQLCLSPATGGDVTLGLGNGLASGPRLDAKGRPLARKRAVAGVVREATLDALPPRATRVGIVRGASSDDIAALAKSHEAGKERGGGGGGGWRR